jgi:hypothetical protein
MKTYAPFFEWYEKAQKELGVVEELLVSLNRSAGFGLHSPQIFAPDPPDCTCLNPSGECVAIEVAEVVCEEAARLNAQGHKVYRNWRPGELVEHIALQLKDKDRKAFQGGPYQGIIACLFTDEPALAVQQVTAELGGHGFGPFAQLTAAFLLFSYDPATKLYPLVQLNVRA